jgi:hypothetical protein
MPNFIVRYREYLNLISDFDLEDNCTNIDADFLHVEVLVTDGPDCASQRSPSSGPKGIWKKNNSFSEFGDRGLD